MATITPADQAKLAGIPSQGGDTILVTPEGLIAGDIPSLFTEDNTFAISQTIPAYTPVGYDGSGDLVPAISGTTQAIGITFYDIVTDAGAKKGHPIYRGGCFAKDMIAWPASYNTDEKKVEAFRGAPSPTAITIRTVKASTVTLP